MPSRRPLTRRAVLAGLLAAAAAGCTDEETASDPPRRSPDSPGGPSGSSDAPESTGPSMPGPLLLNLHTSGGFAGVDRHTLLYEDGTYTVSEKGEPGVTGHIPAAEAERVRRLLDRAELATQPRRSVDPHGADQFVYRIAYDGQVVVRDDFTLAGPLKKALDAFRSAMRQAEKKEEDRG